MISNEKKLAQAIMRGDARIELSSDLSSAVDKIKAPSSVVWASVAAALATSAFFWAGAPAMALGIMVGLPVVLTVCGGVGGVVFVTLGGKGTLCAVRLLIASQTMDVLTNLRDKYKLTDDTLVRI